MFELAVSKGTGAPKVYIMDCGQGLWWVEIDTVISCQWHILLILPKRIKLTSFEKFQEFLDLIKEKCKSLYLQSLFRPIIVNFSFIVISCTFLYLKFDAACSDYLIIWQNFWKFYFLFPVFFQVFLHVLFIHQ